MDKLIISETDRGRYAVRPMNWAGIWNEKGQIKESLNHLALFIEKEDAEKFVEWKEAEEQNRLLKLPCAVGDIIWDIDFGRPYSYEVTGFSFGSMNDDDWEEERILDQVVVYYTNSNGSITGTFAVRGIGKTVFLTREEAEAALKELERGKGE